ncbi:hypothetical protein ACTFIY_007997 [Dictyostelium cf. discoideum]
MYKYNYLFLILIVLFIKGSQAVINPAVGVVEGYYWTQADAVNGQYGSYSFSDRQKLIQMMAANNLGVYWFSPQTVDVNALWNTQELNEWTTIVALGASLNVKIVYGIRPGWLDTAVFPTILARLQQIASSGIIYYTVNFDDAEGVDTTSQQQKEVQLINYLQTNLPSMTLYSVLPFAYYQDMFTSRTKWQNALATINGVSSTIPFVFTGKEIAPYTMQTSQFPTLSPSRPYKFFDNWIAGDTKDRISWGMIDGRVDSVIFTSQYGYFLNLAFPLERVPHHIYCLGLLATGSTTCSVSASATYWANYLNSNGFIHNGKTVSQVATSLTNAINQDNYYDTIADMEAAFPNLATIFSTPPV